MNNEDRSDPHGIEAPRTPPKIEYKDFWIIHFSLVRTCLSNKYFTFKKQSFQTLDFIYNDNFHILLLRK